MHESVEDAVELWDVYKGKHVDMNSVGDVIQMDCTEIDGVKWIKTMQVHFKPNDTQAHFLC